MTTAQSWRRAKKLADLTNLTVFQARTILARDPRKAHLVDILPYKVVSMIQSDWGSGKTRGIKSLEGIERVELREVKPISPEEILIEGHSLEDIKRVREIVRDLGSSKILQILDIIEELDLIE
jgi:hypothetical protein